MLAMFQATQSTDGMLIPIWAISVFSATYLILFAAIGFLIKFAIGSFRAAVLDMRATLEKFVESFQAFKDEAPKEFVTHPFLEIVHKGLKDDIAHGHRRIGEFSERWERELKEHKADCPARSMALRGED